MASAYLAKEEPTPGDYEKAKGFLDDADEKRDLCAMSMIRKSVFIRTLGCQMNVRDSEVICGLLTKKGYKIIDAPDKADIVLFNTWPDLFFGMLAHWTGIE